jgi:short-subunit dehydrogenase
MFKRAASPSRVAEDGIRAMEKGRVLVYEGAFTKLASVGSRIAPRALTRFFALKINR